MTSPVQHATHLQGAGSTPAFGQALMGQHPNVSYTHNNGVYVATQGAAQHDGAGDDAAGDAYSQQHVQVQRILGQSATAPEAHGGGGAAPRSDAPARSGVSAELPPEALPAQGGAGNAAHVTPAQRNTERMATEVLAAAKAATRSGAAQGSIVHEPHPLMYAWRKWLLRRMAHVQRAEFPGPDQPQLRADGSIDMEATAERTARAAQFDALYSDVDSSVAWVWPRTVPSGVVCWHCAHAFDGPPASVPMRREMNGVYVMDGVFCTVPCAVAYIQGMPCGEQMRNTRLMYLAAFVRYALRDDVDMEAALLRPALPLRFLKARGGTMDIDQWREAAHCSEHVTFTERAPPYVPDAVLLEMQSRDAALLQQLKSPHAVCTDPQCIEMPADHVTPREAFAHMRTVPQRTCGSALYAEFCAAADAQDAQA
uniref:MYM-type domain-containing protein n=1 Tax=viral metagenome TaxID=1070528 RepID=A0A6C0AUI9_9ZZZZ